MDERRKFPRLKSSLSLEVKPSAQKEGETHNISQGGLLFAQKTPHTVGSILDLTVRVPGLSGVMNVKGKVVRCESASAGAYMVAVEFVDIDDETAKSIMETIQSF